MTAQRHRSSPASEWPARRFSEVGAFAAQLVPAPTVVLAPHPDDEVFGCGGLLAGLPHAAATTVVYATLGARSHLELYGIARDPTPEELGAMRRDEALRALEVLGIPPANADFLELPDGALAQRGAELEDRLQHVFETKDPASVLLPYRHDPHPDHVALHDRAVACLGSLGSAALVLEYFVYPQRGLVWKRDVRASIGAEHLCAVDVTATLEAKRRAVAAFVSQTRVISPGQPRPIFPPEAVAGYLEPREYYAVSPDAASMSPLPDPSWVWSLSEPVGRWLKFAKNGLRRVRATDP